ncbi:hypothetical protein [Microbulbifer litoralis]|uniref:hypothetical protein n=1 Tax=Microbulbifer litoralis TaxID=2933965 RepID=UPI002029026D|nr:hypothetical protein [Microbulbifer sp. GX H0434]
MDAHQGARRVKNKDVFHPKRTERTDLGAIIVAPDEISGLVGRSQSQVTVRFAKSSSSALRKLEITLLFQRFLALT